MNKFSCFTFLSLMLLPVMLLFFQNCSEMVSSDNVSSFSGSGDNASFTPIMVNTSKRFGFTSQESCENLDEAIPLYNETSHVCYIAADECEYEIMLERGFTQDIDSKCESAIDESNFSPSLLSKKSALELGYENSRDLICTQQYMEMINLKKGICSAASDGCQISYLKSMDFTEDTLNLCN